MPPINRHSAKDLRDDLGKLPPQAIDLEEAILGAIILQCLSPEAKAIMQILCPEHFYKDEHKEIATAIIALDQAGTIADMRSIVTQLRKTGKLEIVGGAFYVAELASKVSSAANLEYYYRIVIELWMRRELILTASQIMQHAYDESIDVFTIIDAAAASIQKLNPDSEIE